MGIIITPVLQMRRTVIYLLSTWLVSDRNETQTLAECTKATVLYQDATLDSCT